MSDLELPDGYEALRLPMPMHWKREFQRAVISLTTPFNLVERRKRMFEFDKQWSRIDLEIIAKALATRDLKDDFGFVTATLVLRRKNLRVMIVNKLLSLSPERISRLRDQFHASIDTYRQMLGLPPIAPPREITDTDLIAEVDATSERVRKKIPSWLAGLEDSWSYTALGVIAEALATRDLKTELGPVMVDLVLKRRDIDLKIAKLLLIPPELISRHRDRFRISIDSYRQKFGLPPIAPPPEIADPQQIARLDEEILARKDYRKEREREAERARLERRKSRRWFVLRK